MVALDPLNRRATRRTFISRVSKGARRVAGGTGRGKGGSRGSPATMRHMARARPDERVPATHAMQFSCRLHHQSVLARSRAPSYRVASPTPPALPSLVPSQPTSRLADPSSSLRSSRSTSHPPLSSSSAPFLLAPALSLSLFHSTRRFPPPLFLRVPRRSSQLLSRYERRIFQN